MTGSSEVGDRRNSVENSRRAWLIALCLSLGTSLAILAPFFWKGNASGHDFSFHAASWIEVAAQWRDGILLPRWAEGANFGFGEPRFIFYPPLSWMLGAALSFIIPWIYVPGVFIVLTQTMAGLSAFALGRRLIAGDSYSHQGAFLCAFLYAANPYALLIVYMRSDFAEQLALVFFPILFLAAFEVASPSSLAGNPVRTHRHSIIFLALTFAAVWLTNAPAAVVASYSLAAFFVYAAIAGKSWRPVRIGGLSLALGLSLAGFYLIPAVREQSWVNISQALSSGLQPSQNFLFTTIADPEHNAFNRTASTTAVLMIALTAISALVCYSRKQLRESSAISKPAWNAFLGIVVLASFLMIRASNIFWIILPKLRFVQFPWRWMSILAVPFACFISAAIVQERNRAYLRSPLVGTLVLILTGTAAWMVQHTWWDTEDIPVLLEAVQNDQGFEGVDEYDPAGDDHSSLAEKSPRITLLAPMYDDLRVPSGAKIHVERWTAEIKELRINSKQRANLALRLLNYPAWRVEVNDVAVAPEPQTGETNSLVIPLEPGSSHVLISFVRTTDRTVGGAVSLGSILIAAILFVRGRKPQI